MTNFFFGALKMLSLALVLSLSSQAFAQGEGKSGKKHEKRHEKMMKGKMKQLEALGLTPEQQEKMKSLHVTQRDEMAKSREAAKAAKKALGEGLDQNKSDGELTSLHESMVTTRSDQMRLRFKHMLQMRALLTDEQRKKFQGVMGEGAEED